MYENIPKNGNNVLNVSVIRQVMVSGFALVNSVATNKTVNCPPDNA